MCVLEIARSAGVKQFIYIDQNRYCANSVDPDETARHEPSHLDLHCFHFVFYFKLKPLFASVDMFEFNIGGVHFRNSGMKYCRLSLSRIRLSRIAAYLEVKIWFLFLHGKLTTRNKIL